MNDLTSRALELQHAAHELMYLGMDGEPVYSDTFCRLNNEEEANLCLALLMGYNATIYDDGDKEQKKQMVLNRICLVLEQLPASLLKVRLLTYTYGEVYEEVLFQEAYAIIEGWNKDNLSSEQTEIIEELKNIEENPYPFEEVE